MQSNDHALVATPFGLFMSSPCLYLNFVHVTGMITSGLLFSAVFYQFTLVNCVLTRGKKEICSKFHMVQFQNSFEKFS